MQMLVSLQDSHLETPQVRQTALERLTQLSEVMLDNKDRPNFKVSLENLQKWSLQLAEKAAAIELDMNDASLSQNLKTIARYQVFLQNISDSRLDELLIDN